MPFQVRHVTPFLALDDGDGGYGGVGGYDGGCGGGNNDEDNCSFECVQTSQSPLSRLTERPLRETLSSLLNIFNHGRMIASDGKDSLPWQRLDKCQYDLLSELCLN